MHFTTSLKYMNITQSSYLHLLSLTMGTIMTCWNKSINWKIQVYGYTSHSPPAHLYLFTSLTSYSLSPNTWACWHLYIFQTPTLFNHKHSPHLLGKCSHSATVGAFEHLLWHLLPLMEGVKMYILKFTSL